MNDAARLDYLAHIMDIDTRLHLAPATVLLRERVFAGQASECIANGYEPARRLLSTQEAFRAAVDHAMHTVPLPP